MSFYEIETTVKCALSPSCIGRPRAGVEKQLHRSLYRYNDELQGIPMSYSKVNFPSGAAQVGKVLNENPWLHVKVNTTVLVFKPSKGDIIQGTVQFITESSVSLLCYGIFNSSIRFFDLEYGGYAWNELNECWEGADSSTIAMGDVMDFSIKSIMSNRGIIDIWGDFQGAVNAQDEQE
jgi:DNA-directed RNA polymerase subunit E'/Rpb7